MGGWQGPCVVSAWAEALSRNVRFVVCGASFPHCNAAQRIFVSRLYGPWLRSSPLGASTAGRAHGAPRWRPPRQPAYSALVRTFLWPSAWISTRSLAPPLIRKVAQLWRKLWKANLGGSQACVAPAGCQGRHERAYISQGHKHSRRCYDAPPGIWQPSREGVQYWYSLIGAICMPRQGLRGLSCLPGPGTARQTSRPIKASPATHSSRTNSTENRCGAA
jgi:hypothetical protein